MLLILAYETKTDRGKLHRLQISLWGSGSYVYVEGQSDIP
jgi:hypothetical protein